MDYRFTGFKARFIVLFYPGCELRECTVHNEIRLEF